MNKSIYINLLLMVLALFSCKEDTAPEATAPDLFLEAPSDRGRSFITLNGSVSASDQIKEVGFVVWQTGTEGGETTYKIDNFSSNRITANIKNLKAGTTYSYYMYVSNDINTKMTEEQDFTTPKTSAALVSATSVNGNTYSAQIEDTGGSNITTKGFCWSTTGKASIFDNTVLIENTGTDITAVIPELASAGSYSIRAFAQNEEGYLAYGAELKHKAEIKVEIEDSVFKKYLLDNFDTDKNGVLSTLEVLAVKKIEVSTINISSLKGIEFFINLEDLQCIGGDLVYNKEQNRWLGTGKLTSLDISKNINLKYLDCSSNKLTKINTATNTKLVEITIYGNSITDLNLSNNIDLQSVFANYNLLKALDVSKNSNLINLGFYDNKVTSLDVSNNLNLNSLVCQQNKLQALDISKNKKLSNLACDWNQLKEIDVSQNKELTYLSCWDNQLTSLDVSNNLELNVLNCDMNKLTSLDVTKNTKLTQLRCDGNYIGPELDISQNKNLVEFSAFRTGINGENPNLQIIWVWKGFDKANDAMFTKPAHATYKEK
ncbi:hypothetical protein [uncultured Parabacteroides sp.]|uniref:leucine-rich repeat domain-containing protein n=1 Tax=uncultured Parabacteroides sp. TaxID=512312 RepID=UPI0025E82391|nr:hypothetical protein [uncultured Parabacteroides sp.]